MKEAETSGSSESANTLFTKASPDSWMSGGLAQLGYHLLPFQVLFSYIQSTSEVEGAFPKAIFLAVM